MNQTSFVRGQLKNIGYQHIFHGFSKFTTIFMEYKLQISDTRGGEIGSRGQKGLTGDPGGPEGVDRGSRGPDI